jgi:hypothetical protein
MEHGRATGPGRGSPSVRVPRPILVAALAFAASMALAPSAGANLAPVSAFPFPDAGFGAPPSAYDPPGVFGEIGAAAINANGTGGASPGDLYVSDRGRIEQLTADDEFVRRWGFDVVAQGPDNSNEVQAVRVDATSGTFKLAFGAQVSADLSATASAAQVQAALQALGAIGPGGVSVSGGPGGAGGTAPYLVSFDGTSTAGKDQPQLVASNGATPLSGGAGASVYTTNQGNAGFEVCDPAAGDECKVGGGGGASDISIDQPTGNLYLNEGTRIGEHAADGHFIRAWGWDVVAAGPDDSNADEVQKVTVKADGGSFKLSFNTSGDPETATLPYNASPAQIESALDAFSQIGGNYSSVTVTGGPGNLAGSNPYFITFHGLLGGDELPTFFPQPFILTASSGSPSVNVSVDTPGGALEVCGVDDACKPGAQGFGPNGSKAGAVNNARGLAVAPAGAPNAGDVLVGDSGNNRVQEFSPDGEFVRLFGWDVIAPGHPGNVEANEVDEVTVHDATGGTFAVSFRGTGGFSEDPTTAPIPFNATAAEVQSALEGVSTIGAGNVSVSGPAGGPWQITFIGALAGLDVPNVYPKAAPENDFYASFGVLLGPQTVTVAGATGGTFILEYGFDLCCGAVLTTPIPYNATAAEVQSALEALHTVGFGHVSVSGPAGGPWQVSFSEPSTPNRALAAKGGALTGPGPSATVRLPRAEAVTTTPGAGFEVCTEASACKAGVAGSDVGKFARSSLAGLAEDSNGNVYTAEEVGQNNRGSRAQKFTPAGGQNLTPGNLGTNEVQTLTVNAAGGQFRLGAYQPNGLRGFSEPIGTIGQGSLNQGSTTITNVTTSQGAFVVGQPIESGDSSSFPFGTYITAVGPGSLTVSQPATYVAGSSSPLTSTRLFTTLDLPYNATASQIEAAVNALPPISETEGSVSVSGSPGGPYQISFDGGQLARTDPPRLIGSQGTTPLSGGSGPGANTANIQTTTPGGPGGIRVRGFEFLRSEDSLKGISTGPSGEIFVVRNYVRSDPCAIGVSAPSELRIQELDSSGAVLQTSDPCAYIKPTLSGGGGSGEASLAVDLLSGRPSLVDNGDCSVCDHRLVVFGPSGPPPALSLNPPSDVSSSGATISGTINPNGPGEGYPAVSGDPTSYRTTYRVEYKKSSQSTWNAYLPDTILGAGTSPIPFSVGIAGLEPKTPYDLRVVIIKPFNPGGTVAAQQSITTDGAPPAINAFHSSGITATSADLHALINPQGTDTTYHFEYGTSIAYGQSTPETDIGSSLEAQDLEVGVGGLEDTLYHFRVVATNSFGTTTSEDQTFLFHSFVCPNQTVRQQTGAAYLPDCRAYELVSPENAGGTTFYTGGPQSAYATNPARLAFVGLFGQPPGAGSTAINGVGDLYVATRGPNGWSTRYVGLDSTQAGCMGGRPLVAPFSLPTTIQNDVFASADLSRVIDWNLGNPLECVRQLHGNFGYGDENTASEGSNSPYVWSSGGDLLGRWPTDLEATPGAEANFACPQDPSLHPYPSGVDDNVPVSYFCSTEVTASKDLNHFIFSTQSGLFGQGGITSAPGSAYDNDTANGTLSLISVLPDSEGGGPIGQDPGSKAGPDQLIQFPHVSTDGSRILMGVGSGPHCRLVTFDEPPCPLVEQPTHLYLRVDDTETYDVSADSGGVGRSVTYLGSTDDGTRVYFTTALQMTPDDTDHSIDLYLWDENHDSPTLTRVSEGQTAAAGNFDNCSSTWAAKCGIAPYRDSSISSADANKGGLGNWAYGFEFGYASDNPNPGYTDNSIAAASGDIYFYSPEQLLSGKGVPSRENVYVLHDGSLQFVAALSTDRYCIDGVNLDFLLRPGRCSDGAIGRLQVTADGHYAAFVTTSRITAYDNAGHAEMYRYDAEAEQVLCVSCNPDGSPPTSDVFGSMGGRFITDDGRVFFDTAEPLDSRDTNHGKDTYEFVEGRPQLITSGTGNGASGTGLSAESTPGLYGVSANGTDVYFGSFDTLVSQDRNGAGQLKFYDARSSGGFLANPAPQPCAAADECHGETSGPPAALENGSGASLGDGGNYKAPAAHKKRHHRHHRRHHHRVRGGSR